MFTRWKSKSWNGNFYSFYSKIVLSEAVKIGLKKAEEYGISFVGTCNTPTSTGCLAYYANEITKAGFVCFLFAGSPASVAPYGSNQKLFGTNPLCIGVPSKSLPIILDMSTSSMAYYGLLEAKTAKKQVSLDIGFDSDGNPTTDPGKILDGGSIRTFDKGHKSGGLNLMVEILTGPLVQASFASFGDENNWGNLLIVLNPKLFTEDLKTEVENLVSKVKSLRKLNQNYEIYVPGEKGGKKFQQAIEKQKVEIETNLYYELLKVSGSTIQSKL